MAFIARSPGAILGAIVASALCAAVQAADAPKDAEAATAAANAKVKDELNFADRRDFEAAKRGFVASIPGAEVKNSDGRVVYSLKGFEFLLASDDAPPSVNPSLWRHAQVNQLHGLFKVTDRVYQVRAMDISNMTIVEGDTGLILIDPLLSAETARAALDLYLAHRPKKPVVAVVYTHSHVDHFGGVRGVIDEADVIAGKVKVIAPTGFTEHAVSENVIAGNAMGRRAQFQFGSFIPPGVKGQVDTGLGTMLSRGRITLIAPNDLIEKSMDTRTVDGVQMVFQLTPGTEAPAELNVWFPQFKVFDAAENVTHTIHNLYTLRGAEIRDGLAWARYIDESRELFGAQADVMIAQHTWPTWGRERIDTMLAKQRDLYKFIHDQTVRLMNHGLKPAEIAEQLRLPDSIGKEWFARGYYGTVSHNAKAVYQRYLGWYDANPAHLNPLPEPEAAKKYVDYMGGASAVIVRARDDYKAGNYRWVAEVMNQVVFADPTNTAARALEADALEQLGYQAESGVWRNVYLTAAMELRNGVTAPSGVSTTSADVIKAIPLSLFFDYLAVRLDARRAEGKRMVVNWNFTDVKQQVRLTLENSVLSHQIDRPAANPDATITLKRATLDQISLRQKSFADAVGAGEITLSGNGDKLAELLGLVETFPPMFDVVTPQQARR